MKIYSDQVQVVAIFNLSFFLKYLTIIFTFSFFQIFELMHATMSSEFLINLFLGKVIFSHVL